MARYSGKIGYAIGSETSPGIWESQITECDCKGDIITARRSNQQGENVNDNIVLNSTFSVLGDAFSYDNFLFIKYITFMGVKWRVTAVEVVRPRLLLTVGGVYNG